MPTYSKKEPFAVYNVISAKDAFALLKKFSSNSNFNTEDAEHFFVENGVTVFGLVAPAIRLSDKINLHDVETNAETIAKEGRSPGRS
ncbi:hypothetical protein GEU84_008200 [Fertoebacter nigrum]|uniref:Uncharacterized protein n=1 Tax=Fertoeibacter niger TaxID=2656921 RepID=A0A8X8KP04_9RHOB|nr:hypothetical protein [Fertoeibacter niger]NUB44361.1 hypothetical protein [Fertoeibacter niger]